MGASKNAFFLQANLCPQNSSFRGGGILGLGGGEVPILFYGRGDFSDQNGATPRTVGTLSFLEGPPPWNSQSWS